MTTRDARKNPWGLIAALSSEDAASGELYVDDGESVVQNATLFVTVSAHPTDPTQPPSFPLLLLNLSVYLSICLGLFR